MKLTVCPENGPSHRMDFTYLPTGLTSSEGRDVSRVRVAAKNHVRSLTRKIVEEESGLIEIIQHYGLQVMQNNSECTDSRIALTRHEVSYLKQQAKCQLTVKSRDCVLLDYRCIHALSDVLWEKYRSAICELPILCRSAAFVVDAVDCDFEGTAVVMVSERVQTLHVGVRGLANSRNFVSSRNRCWPFRQPAGFGLTSRLDVVCFYSAAGSDSTVGVTNAGTATVELGVFNIRLWLRLDFKQLVGKSFGLGLELELQDA
ncbi:hypothetical protein Tco_1482959 [Tanacetum coccineum]